MDEANFAAILAGAQAGADWALRALYRDHNPALHRFLTARAGSAAEDVGQEIWIAVARGLRSFEGPEPAFRAWLYTIARRRLIQHYRDAARRPSVAFDPADLEGALAPAGDPGDDITSEEAVSHLIAGLPPDLAEIVLLRVVGGFDAEEVGRIVGKNSGAVRVAQHRALRRIAKRLAGEAVTP